MFFNLRRLLHDFRIYQKKWFLSDASDKLPKRLGVVSCVSLIMLYLSSSKPYIKNSQKFSKKTAFKSFICPPFSFLLFFLHSCFCMVYKKSFREKKVRKVKHQSKKHDP